MGGHGTKTGGTGASKGAGNGRKTQQDEVFYVYNVYEPQGGTSKCQELYDVVVKHVKSHGKPFVMVGDHNNKKG